MVRDGQALVFRKDVSKFQRRAICDFHGKTIIIEEKPSTLQSSQKSSKSAEFRMRFMSTWEAGCRLVPHTRQHYPDYRTDEKFDKTTVQLVCFHEPKNAISASMNRYILNLRIQYHFQSGQNRRLKSDYQEFSGFFFSVICPIFGTLALYQ